MTTRKLLPQLLAALLVVPAAHASVDLIAVGKISGAYQDLAFQTAAPLENGVAGNTFGGIGSGLAFAGGHTFLATPDRGPNANAYDSAVDDTVTFIPRFQTLSLALAPSEAGSALPYVLTPFLTKTTLLWNGTPLVYGSGEGLGVGDGAPALNDRHTYYFSGRSDNFDPKRSSTNPSNARLDLESIRVSNDGKSVFISDEYGPYVYQFDRETGRRLRAFALPAKLAVATLSSQGDTEISDNTSGRLANKGMEGLAITPDGKTLVGSMQSPLIQDGGKKAGYTRIVTIDIRTGATHEYAYPLTNIGTDAKPKYPTISDIVAVNDHEFLVDERDGAGLGDGSSAEFKHLYHIDLSGAADVSNVSGESSLAPLAVQKTLFLDLVSVLNANGISSDNIPSKIEGLAFGEDIVVDGVTKHTLYIANDNDFLANVDGVDNPNTIFVFTVDSSDLPGYVAQPLKTGKSCDKDHDEHHGRDRH